MNLTSAPAGRAAPGNGQPGVRSWLLGINPAAKLIAACVISFGLIPAVDPVTGGIVLAVTALLLPFSGINRATLLVLSVPFCLMGLSTWVVNLLYGEEGLWGGVRRGSAHPRDRPAGDAGRGQQRRH